MTPNKSDSGELRKALSLHGCEDGRTLICLAGDEFYLSPAAEIDLIDRVTAHIQAEKEDSYYRGINHAGMDLMRHDKHLTLERLSREVADYEDRKRKRLAQYLGEKDV